MKKVLLLGDSIRMGYDEFVKEELKDEFEVYYDNDDNGRFSAYTIWQFNLLNNQHGPFDIVHFNNGYWDMNHEGPKLEEACPIEDYLHNFKRLLELIRETGATPIFATTIPIYDMEEDDPNYQKINYRNEWVLKYNQAALKFMEQEHVQVNDLYNLIVKEPHYLKCPDSLHLLEEGYKLCAHQVADVIRNVSKELAQRKDVKIRITVKKITVYEDLIKEFENPIEHACSLKVGDEFISINGLKPDNLCDSAWYSMKEYVTLLSLGQDNFFDGWMKNKKSAMISCNDGFRPVSFYIEVIE